MSAVVDWLVSRGPLGQHVIRAVIVLALIPVAVSVMDWLEHRKHFPSDGKDEK
jgi:hypothetical protein